MSSAVGKSQHPLPQPGYVSIYRLRPLRRRRKALTSTGTDPSQEGPRWSAVKALLAAGSVAVAILFAVLALLVVLGDDSPEASLVLVFVSSGVALILVVATLAIVLRRLGLTDRSEAMGLPSGTIRAIIALLLVMLFFVAAIVLFNGTQYVADPTQTRTLTGISADRFATIPIDQVESSEARVVDDVTVYDVSLYPPPSATTTSDDIAKQLITTVGTLVTAVAAFYFGASSVKAARKEDGDLIVAAEGEEIPDQTEVTETKKEDGKTTTEEATSTTTAPTTGVEGEPAPQPPAPAPVVEGKPAPHPPTAEQQGGTQPQSGDDPLAEHLDDTARPSEGNQEGRNKNE